MKFRQAQKQVALNRKDQANVLEIQKAYKSKIQVKLIISLVVFLVLLLLAIVFVRLGGGRFSSAQTRGWLLIFLIFLTFTNIGALIYIFYGELKEKYYVLGYKYFDIIHFILIIASIVFFLQVFIFKTALVEGSSMEPTLHEGDNVFVFQTHSQFRKNQIVVMNAVFYPEINDQSFEPINSLIEKKYYVKRIKAVPGDYIAYLETEDGLHLYVNDELIQIITNQSYQKITKHIIDEVGGIMPTNKFLLLGDNVGGSKDSRSFGFVDEKDILGIVRFRFYKRIGFVK